MKKLKSILCMALIVCSFILVACKSKDPDTPPQTPGSTTITLAEAKSTIVNALATNNMEVQSSFFSTSNRNVFTKLNTVEISIEGKFDYGTTISGTAEKNILGNWTKYSLQSGENYGYYDGDNAYLKNNLDYWTTTFEYSYFGLILQSMDCIYIDLLFLDDAFDSIYGDTVKKISTKDVYTLTMDIDMSKYVDYVMVQCELRDLPAEGLFGEGDYLQRNKDEGSVVLVINFDNDHNILGLDMVINSLYSESGVTSLQETKINITKSNQEITQPQWVTDYLENQ